MVCFVLSRCDIRDDGHKTWTCAARRRRHGGIKKNVSFSDGKNMLWIFRMMDALSFMYKHSIFILTLSWIECLLHCDGVVMSLQRLRRQAISCLTTLRPQSWVPGLGGNGLFSVQSGLSVACTDNTSSWLYRYSGINKRTVSWTSKVLGRGRKVEDEVSCWLPDSLLPKVCFCVFVALTLFTYIDTSLRVVLGL